jgi:hypothetical protein
MRGSTTESALAPHEGMGMVKIRKTLGIGVSLTQRALA